mmetsp:Transcript_55710/g.113894  ORF Transcript_55710/g.113894 Transcript_55710/m.113894 type:complete len:324 (+) Transcript_55710:3-974(+)
MVRLARAPRGDSMAWAVLVLVAMLPLAQSSNLYPGLFISLDANSTDGNATDAEVYIAPEGFNLRHAVNNLDAYERAHPGFAKGIGIWMAIGLGVFFFGNVVLLYSEVKAVLVCRDQDFRIRMKEMKYMMAATKGIDALEAKESNMMAPRAYLTVGSLLLMYIGLSCMVYPLCDVLDVVGLPAAPCLVLVVLGSFCAAFTIACFWMFICWSCARPWAALAFLIISLTGSIFLPTGSLIMVILWVIVAFGGGWWYFKYLPDLYEVNSDPRPFWLQDVGHITVSCSPTEWEDAQARTWNNMMEDARNMFPEPGFQSEANKEADKTK